MPLLHTLWSPDERTPRHVAPIHDDDESWLGWECALPALQVEAWEPTTTSARDQGSAPIA